LSKLEDSQSIQALLDYVEEREMLGLPIVPIIFRGENADFHSDDYSQHLSTPERNDIDQ
jgi:hypothetical protein